MSEDRITLPSGKSFHANHGLVGINSKLEVSEGYDGMLDDYDNYLSPQERRELSEYMIDLWRKFGAIE